jgi:hypothetical protein
MEGAFWEGNGKNYQIFDPFLVARKLPAQRICHHRNEHLAKLEVEWWGEVDLIGEGEEMNTTPHVSLDLGLMQMGDVGNQPLLCGVWRTAS